MDGYLTSSKNLTISGLSVGSPSEIALELVKAPFTMGRGIGKSKGLLPAMSPQGQGTEDPPEAGRGKATWQRLSGGSMPT